MIRSYARAAMVAMLIPALIGAAPAVARKRPRPPPSWQQIADNDDRERLRTWRDTWLEGLRQARRGGAGDAIAAAGPLLDPDAGLPGIVLSDGRYRCHTIRLGSVAGSAPVRGDGYAASAPQPCRIAAGRLTILAGMQRPSGMLYPHDGSRLVFLGAMAVGDETRALDYGRDTVRDMIGMVDRIGDRRWRLFLPRPRWQSLIDVVEIVPADG